MQDIEDVFNEFISDFLLTFELYGIPEICKNNIIDYLFRNFN